MSRLLRICIADAKKTAESIERCGYFSVAVCLSVYDLSLLPQSLHGVPKINISDKTQSRLAELNLLLA